MSTKNNSIHETERELKNLLTTFQYDRLCKYFEVQISHCILQVNEYFDTADFALDEQNAILRSRTRKSQRELTFKEDNGKNIRNETHHRPFTDDELARLKDYGVIPAGPIFDAVSRCTTERVSSVGQISTNRATVDISLGKIMLDVNWTEDGQNDYEIELELAHGVSMKQGEKYLAELFKRYRTKRKQAPSKFRRLIRDRLKEK